VIADYALRDVAKPNGASGLSGRHRRCTGGPLMAYPKPLDMFIIARGLDIYAGYVHGMEISAGCSIVAGKRVKVKASPSRDALITPIIA
jgi:hypothetical protein